MPGDQLDEAFALLSRRAPVFLVGRGVISESATKAMAELAERTGIPVAALQYSPDAFPTTHALALGPLGRNGFASANRTVPKADVIVAIGAHMDVFSTMYKYGIFSEQAKLIHHTAAPGQIGIVFPVTLGVTGSTSSFIKGLAERAAKAGLKKSWMDVAKARAECEAEQRADLRMEAEPIQSQFVAHTIRKVLPKNGILVVDAGNGGKQSASFKATSGELHGIDDGRVGGSLRSHGAARAAAAPGAVSIGRMGAMCNIGESRDAMRGNSGRVVASRPGSRNERRSERALRRPRLRGRVPEPDFGALARGSRIGEQ